MHKILAASFTFGISAKEEDLRNMFLSYHAEVDMASLEEATEKLQKYDGIIIGTEKTGAELFENAKNLKAIIKYCVGTDNIDMAAAEKHGVNVLNMPGVNSDAVSELTLGLMLSVARRIVKSDRDLRSGKWNRELGTSVRGKTLGIVGSGSIGRDLMRLTCGLEMKILAYDAVPNQEALDLGARYVPLSELLKQADFVSIHLPLTRETHHFIGPSELSMMQKHAVLINTSRGGLMDEQALVEALKANRIAGAGIDVFESEPPLSSDLLGLENVVCTSHIAAYTRETLSRMDRECVAKLMESLGHK